MKWEPCVVVEGLRQNCHRGTVGCYLVHPEKCQVPPVGWWCSRKSYADRGEYPCWTIKRGDEYLDAPHWRIWGDSRFKVRFRTRAQAERYVYEKDERVVKIVRRPNE